MKLEKFWCLTDSSEILFLGSFENWHQANDKAESISQVVWVFGEESAQQMKTTLNKTA